MKRLNFKSMICGLLLALAFLSSGCSERIDAGHVGIKVNMYGSDKGVQDVTMVTGRVWYNPITSSVYEIPTFMQTAAWTKDETEGSPTDEAITFQTNDGMETSCDVALNFTLDADKVPAMFKKFRRDPEELKATYLRVKVREIFMEEASKYSIEDMILKRAEFLKDVEMKARSVLAPDGFIVDTLTLVGSPRYPATVSRAIENKIRATQLAEQAQRELATSQAEAAKVAAQAKGEAESIKVKAEAEAEAIRKITQSLTPTYVEYVKATKWNGQYPGVVAGSGAGLLLDARGK